MRVTTTYNCTKFKLSSEAVRIYRVGTLQNVGSQLYSAIVNFK